MSFGVEEFKNTEYKKGFDKGYALAQKESKASADYWMNQFNCENRVVEGLVKKLGELQKDIKD